MDTVLTAQQLEIFKTQGESLTETERIYILNNLPRKPSITDLFNFKENKIQNQELVFCRYTLVDLYKFVLRFSVATLEKLNDNINSEFEQSIVDVQRTDVKFEGFTNFSQMIPNFKELKTGNKDQEIHELFLQGFVTRGFSANFANVIFASISQSFQNIFHALLSVSLNEDLGVNFFVRTVNPQNDKLEDDELRFYTFNKENGEIIIKNLTIWLFPFDDPEYKLCTIKFDVVLSYKNNQVWLRNFTIPDDWCLEARNKYVKEKELAEKAREERRAAQQQTVTDNEAAGVGVQNENEEPNVSEGRSTPSKSNWKKYALGTTGALAVAAAIALPLLLGGKSKKNKKKKRRAHMTRRVFYKKTRRSFTNAKRKSRKNKRRLI